MHQDLLEVIVEVDDAEEAECTVEAPDEEAGPDVWAKPGGLICVEVAADEHKPQDGDDQPMLRSRERKSGYVQDHAEVRIEEYLIETSPERAQGDEE